MTDLIRVGNPTPAAHHASHEHGGSDAVTVQHGDLSGVSSDQHHAKGHSHNGDGSGSVAATSLAVNADKVLYVSHSGVVTDLALGAAGTVLQSMVNRLRRASR